MMCSHVQLSFTPTILASDVKAAVSLGEHAWLATPAIRFQDKALLAVVAFFPTIAAFQRGRHGQ